MPTRAPLGFRSGRYGTNARRELMNRLIARISLGWESILNVRAESDKETDRIEEIRFLNGTERNWRNDLNATDRRTAALVPSFTSHAYRRPRRNIVERG